MRVVFRTDASLAIGTGHVMRCLTLAVSLRERDAAVSFVCREHDGHLCDLIEARGFAVSRLPVPNTEYQAEPEPAHASWLGASWRDDCEQTRTAIEGAGAKADWLVVDHYAVDHRWESALRKSVGRIMVIDDLADRVHDCDLLLDQNLVAQMRTRYADKVPAACGRLLGPDYALLQPIYAELHDRIPPREGQIRRLFIFFGGADSDNITGRALTAFLQLNRPDIEVDVVVTEGSPHAAAILQQVTGHDNIHLHSGLPTLGPLMAKADLAVGGSGATSWERLCLGLPALVVTLADNQRAIADGLSQRDLVNWLGQHDEVNELVIARALGKLLGQGLHEDWSRRCLALVDGKGVDRVCAVLITTATTPLRVRYAKLADEAQLLAWNNDYATPRNDAIGGVIPATAGRIGFRDDLRNLDGCWLYIAETIDGEALGQVRFERLAQAWEFDFVLAHEFKGRSLERPMVQAGLRRFRADMGRALTFGQPPYANARLSQKFNSLGFDNPRQAGQAQWRIGVCSDADSWINDAIPELIVDWLAAGHSVSWGHDAAELPGGDLCFYLSYGRVVGPELLARHKNNLVVHESDLPRGRGWSPLTWQVLEGKSSIPVTLLEAVNAVDSGPIYLREAIELRGNELVEDLRRLQADATFLLCRRFVLDYPMVLGKARKQVGDASYYQRRRPANGQMDVDKPLREYINLLRVSDNNRYPAWIDLNGRIIRFRLES